MIAGEFACAVQVINSNFAFPLCFFILHLRVEFPRDIDERLKTDDSRCKCSTIKYKLQDKCVEQRLLMICDFSAFIIH